MARLPLVGLSPRKSAIDLVALKCPFTVRIPRQEELLCQKVRVFWHVTMSLDGFVAGPRHEVDWMSLSWLPARSGMPDLAQRVLDSLGAILGGRRWYEAARDLDGVEGIYGGKWDGPVLVLTTHPDTSPYDP